MSEDEPLIRLREIASDKKAIVFIHGIGAKNPEEYWKQFTDVLLDDTNSLVREFDVFVWGYPTHKGPDWLVNIILSLRGKTFIDASPAIERLGSLWRTTYETQFAKYQDIVLVCHSMGGLVIQSSIADILEEGRSTELETLRHIAFYGIPSSGAPIAKVAYNSQLEGMTVTSRFVASIRKRWNLHVVKWNNVQIKAEYRYYNHFIPHLVLAGIEDKVVPRNFAEIIDMPCKDIPGNHTTLIQPANADDTRYKIWRGELEKTLNSKDLSKRPSAVKATAHSHPKSESLLDDHFSAEEPKKLIRADPKQVLVIYGRNNIARNEIFAFLRTIGLSPLNWEDAIALSGKAAPFMSEVLEAAFNIAQAIVVLLTGDDEARLRSKFWEPHSPEYEKILTPQSRPNVLFEAGLAFGLQPQRTILVEWGQLRPFSDISGRHVIRVSNKPEKRFELAQKLQVAGCQVDFKNIYNFSWKDSIE